MSAGRWTLVPGRCRCSLCGGMVEETWRWFEGATWTSAICVPCAEDLAARVEEEA